MVLETHTQSTQTHVHTSKQYDTDTIIGDDRACWALCILVEDPEIVERKHYWADSWWIGLSSSFTLSSLASLFLFLYFFIMYCNMLVKLYVYACVCIFVAKCMYTLSISSIFFSYFKDYFQGWCTLHPRKDENVSVQQRPVANDGENP